MTVNNDESGVGAGVSNGIESGLERQLGSGAPKRMLFVGDPHGRFDALKWVTGFAKSKGIEDRIWLGDLTYDLSSKFSSTAAVKSRQFKAMLQDQESPLYKAIVDGEFSYEQLEAISKIEGVQKNIVAAHAKKTYENAITIDSKAKVIPGNWDVKKPFFDVFGDNALFHKSLELNGMDVVALGGGGSAPVGVAGIEEGFVTDDVAGREFLIEKAQPLIVNPQIDSIDMIIDHCGIPKEGRKYNDQHSLILRDMLFKRYELGLELPKVVVNGHHHRDTAEIEFREYVDPRSGMTMEILNFAPAVLAKNHNSGSQGVFCIADFDSDNRLVGVEEYHVLNSVSGIMKVMFYGKHTIDHDKKKVEFEEIKKVVAEENEFETFEKSLELDANYAFGKKGLDVDYGGLNAKQMDLKLRQNLAVMQEYIEESSSKIKYCVDETKLEWQEHLRDLGTSKVTHAQKYQIALDMAVKMAKEAAKVFEINLDEIDVSTISKLHYYQALSEAAFGVRFDDILESIEIPGDDFDNVGHNFGVNLHHQNGAALKRVANNYQNRILFDLEAEDFTRMVDEVYASKNVQRTCDLSKDEVIGLYARGLNSGVLSSSDILDSNAGNAYKKLEGIGAGKKFTGDEIDEMFNIKRQEEWSFGNSDSLEMSVDRAREQLRRTQENSGRENGESRKLLSDSQGVYVLGDDSKKYYVPSEIVEELGYDTIAIKEVLAEGGARLVESAGNYAVELGQVPGKYFTIDLEEEGIDIAVDGVQVVKKWQAEQENLQRSSGMNRGMLNDLISQIQRSQNESSVDGDTGGSGYGLPGAGRDAYGSNSSSSLGENDPTVANDYSGLDV